MPRDNQAQGRAQLEHGEPHRPGDRGAGAFKPQAVANTYLRELTSVLRRVSDSGMPVSDATNSSKAVRWDDKMATDSLSW